jgi:plastocyanin
MTANGTLAGDMWRRATLLLLLFPAVAGAHPGHGPAIVRAGVGLDNRFDPQTVTVGVGDNVIWRFEDGLNSHTVTADDGSFDSGQRSSGEFTHRYTEEGTFGYHCEVHPQMFGQVTVVPVASADTQAPRLSRVRVSRRRGRYRLRFRLSERAAVLGRIRRRSRTVRSFDVAGQPGANRKPIRTAGLAPGRYRVALTAFDVADNQSATVTARLRVRRR